MVVSAQSRTGCTSTLGEVCSITGPGLSGSWIKLDTGGSFSLDATVPNGTISGPTISLQSTARSETFALNALPATTTQSISVVNVGGFNARFSLNYNTLAALFQSQVSDPNPDRKHRYAGGSRRRFRKRFRYC